jgi:hypothetical protein
VGMRLGFLLFLSWGDHLSSRMFCEASWESWKFTRWGYLMVCETTWSGRSEVGRERGFLGNEAVAWLTMYSFGALNVSLPGCSLQ